MNHLPKALEAKRDELADKFTERSIFSKEFDSEVIKFHGRCGYVYGFDACFTLLEPELERLKSALEFYANAKESKIRFEKSPDEAFGDLLVHGITVNYMDSDGALAKAALEELKRRLG